MSPAPTLAAMFLAALAASSAFAADEVPAAANANGKIPRLEATAARNDAARFGFVESLFLSYVAEKCGKLPEPTRSRAKQAQADWRKRNQYLVNPTFFWATYRSALAGGGEAAMSEHTLAILTGYESEAKQKAKAVLPARKPTVEACDAQLARFEDPALDLKLSAHAPALQEIREYSYLFGERVPAPGPGASGDH